jgi:hypothetical protein
VAAGYNASPHMPAPHARQQCMSFCWTLVSKKGYRQLVIPHFYLHVDLEIKNEFEHQVKSQIRAEVEYQVRVQVLQNEADDLQNDDDIDTYVKKFQQTLDNKSLTELENKDAANIVQNKNNEVSSITATQLNISKKQFCIYLGRKRQ